MFFGLCAWVYLQPILNDFYADPTRLVVDHVKTTLFLSRKANNSACPSWLVSVPMHTALSETLGSKGIFLNLPSASMTFLYFVKAFTLSGHVDC
jgi:hypothetical protein